MGKSEQVDRLLTAAEVAERLNVGERFVRHAREYGLLPAVKLGNHYIRFKESDVDAFVARGYEKNAGAA